MTPIIPTTDQILGDPCVSYWLKDAVRACLRRDPCDAIADAELLLAVLKAEQVECLPAETATDKTTLRAILEMTSSALCHLDTSHPAYTAMKGAHVAAKLAISKAEARK